MRLAIAPGNLQLPASHARSTQIFEPDFIDAVDPSATDARSTKCTNARHPTIIINRMMHLDLKFTLADNDLRKVGTMTEAAGIEVRYPLLDDRMVAFANPLPVDYKVRGQTAALVLQGSAARPAAGKDHQQEQARVRPAVRRVEHTNTHRSASSSATACPTSGSAAGSSPPTWTRCCAMQRGPHASYYGVMIWVMMMLEQWLQANEH